MAEEIKSDTTDTTEKKGNENEKPVKAEKKKVVVKSEKKSNVPAKPAKEKVKIIDRFKKFLRDYKSELKKIVWPSRPQVIQNTGVVLVAIVFMALVVGLLDLLFGLGLQGITGIKGLITG